jgi:hypothetical protein
MSISILAAVVMISISAAYAAIAGHPPIRPSATQAGRFRLLMVGQLAALGLSRSTATRSSPISFPPSPIVRGDYSALPPACSASRNMTSL